MTAPSVTQIGPHQGLFGLDVADLWAHRELLYFLAWRDVKVRYSQTLLGIAWALLQPALTMVVLTFAFARVPGLAPEGVAYPLFALCGLVPWLFFSNAVLAGTTSLVASANLVTKVYFPRLLVPTAALFAGLPDLALSCGLLGLVMAWFGYLPGAALWYFPVAVALLLAVALGVSLWTSALTVRYRDVRHAVPFVLQIGLFVTPVVYSLDTVSRQWRLVLELNPMTGVVAVWRAALLGAPFSGAGLVVCVGVAAVLLCSGIIAFRTLERDLADVI